MASQGNALAQSNVGLFYADGHGVDQDFKEAMTWYRKAANQRHAIAQYSIGVMFDYGNRMDNVSNKAMKCSWKAADQGFEEVRKPWSVSSDSLGHSPPTVVSA